MGGHSWTEPDVVKQLGELGRGGIHLHQGVPLYMTLDGTTESQIQESN